MSLVKEIFSEAEFEEYFKKSSKGLAIVHFGASWSPNSKQINDILNSLSEQASKINLFYVEAEKLPQIGLKYEITGVPTLLFLQNNKIVKTLKGGHPKELKSALIELSKCESDLENQLKSLINSDTIMLFMKGSPEEPKCGFSRKIIEILSNCDAVYKSFDILSDNDVREGLKKYSNWPTYPQLYIKGEMVGGIDIVQEMHASGELGRMIRDAICVDKSKLEDRLKSLINKDKVVLFMKGSPDTPRCGFSRQTVEMLRKNEIQFEYFDILSDDQVRQGLKEYSKWPTYPQLYSSGELIGGFDIIKELDATNELVSSLN